jgi:hypothetical protein
MKGHKYNKRATSFFLFCKKGDCLIQNLKGKLAVCMINTINESKFLNLGKHERKNGAIIKKSSCALYNTTNTWNHAVQNSFGIVGGGVQLGPLGTAATNRPIVPSLGDYDDGEIGGMIGRGNRSTQRKTAPVSLCPPQTPHAAWTRTRAAMMGSQRLTAWATAQPRPKQVYCIFWSVFSSTPFLCRKLWT